MTTPYEPTTAALAEFSATTAEQLRDGFARYLAELLEDPEAAIGFAQLTEGMSALVIMNGVIRFAEIVGCRNQTICADKTPAAVHVHVHDQPEPPEIGGYL